VGPTRRGGRWIRGSAARALDRKAAWRFLWTWTDSSWRLQRAQTRRRATFRLFACASLEHLCGRRRNADSSSRAIKLTWLSQTIFWLVYLVARHLRNETLAQRDTCATRHMRKLDTCVKWLVSCCANVSLRKCRLKQMWFCANVLQQINLKRK
jgi:hypothetical protein